jgi:heterodisulfide reductase subunit D
VSLRPAVDRTKAYLCLECGICTGSCPVSRHNPAYSPRMTVERALLLGEDESVCDHEMWGCLTCGTCDLRCPSTVDFTGFMRSLREKARERGEEGVCTHAETLLAIFEIQTRPDFRKSSVWLERGVKTQKRAKTYYFTGCLPFLEVVFRDIGFRGSRMANSALRLLNRLSMVPAMSEHEVCCGHDAYWTGRTDLARDLARRNAEVIRGTGARQVVFSCPEGYRMFKDVYPTLIGSLGFEPVHILSLMAEKSKALQFSPVKKKVTYQDPCRLAKSGDIIDEPRSLLRSIPELELVEMRRTGKDAVCCGSSNWVSCSRVNKRIQVERLDEAVSTGAEILLTACPKCNIHLRCALRDEDTSGEIDIRDMVTLLAESLGGRKRGT